MAFIYMDPGTGAMLWQALVAGFLGVLFFFRKFFSFGKSGKPKNDE